ncbi:MAG: hypothetical protein JXA90_05075, partial [Planctomycetes bacterium]|nr:hypothetical protein [Planctomycetota bacterium]
MKGTGLVGCLAALLAVGTLSAQTFDLGLSGGLPCGGAIEKVSPGGGAVLQSAVEVDCTLTSYDIVGEKGAQGWSISLAAENLEITAITTAGTVAAPAPDGLWVGGFNKTETT